MQDKTIELRVGNASLHQRLTPVPSNTSDGAAEWMAYFNVNDTRFGPMLEETGRLVAERLRGRKVVVVTPETAPIALVHILRNKHGIPAQNMGKKKRPHMGPATMREDYHAVTNTAVNSLYFEGMDAEIGFDPATHKVVLFDNVVTTGGTFGAASRLLRRWYPSVVIEECIVMFTEGYEPFDSLQVDDLIKIPIVALGGHIPIFRESQIANGVALRPPQFTFNSSARFPTAYAPDKNVQFAVFSNYAGVPAVAVVGPGTFSGTVPEGGKWSNVTVRVHDACLTSECFFSCKCDCREQLELAMRQICSHGGIVIYLFQEGRGIGLANKIRAYFFQTMAGFDTVDANRALGLPDDARSYVAVRDILNHFQIASIRLMTNNPRKITELTNLGIVVAERISAEVEVTSQFAARYQHTKAVSMGHLISPNCFENALKKGDKEVKIIRFYESDGEHGWMSNFFPCQVEIGGQTYQSTEHYYQSRKFAHPDTEQIRAEVAGAISAKEAFELSRKYGDKIAPDWTIRRKREMFRALMAKFKRNSKLRELLIATGDALIVEDSPTDAFWGCGADGKGENRMGQMLSNIRLALVEHNFDPTHPLIY